MTILNLDLQGIYTRVLSQINYLTSDDQAVEGADVTKDDIIRYINDKYLQEIVPFLRDKDPEFFSEEHYDNTYMVTGTVDATSTSTTLVATTPIFSNVMVDGIVYNSTDKVFRNIVGYTDNETLTVDTAIGDDWDGDTIYVFTGIYTFGGSMQGISKEDWVGVKYLTTDNDFTRATRSTFRDEFKTQKGRDRNALYSTLNPKFYFDTMDIGGTPKSAIVLKPIPTVAITEGLYIKVRGEPKQLVNDNDVPRLPTGHVMVLVNGAIAEAFRKMRLFSEAQQYDALYEKGKMALFRQAVAERPKRQVDFENRSLVYYRR